MYNYYTERYGALGALDYLPDLAEKTEVQLLAMLIRMHTSALEALIEKHVEGQDE